jgi:hypothetical protein
MREPAWDQDSRQHRTQQHIKDVVGIDAAHEHWDVDALNVAVVVLPIAVAQHVDRIVSCRRDVSDECRDLGMCDLGPDPHRGATFSLESAGVR